MATAKQVREWARTHGYHVGDRGVISPDIWEAYAVDQGDTARVRERGESWRCGGCERRWSGTRECHCTVCHRHFSTAENFDAHRPRGHCVPPETAKIDGYHLKERQTQWGPIYVLDKEHYHASRTDTLFE